ncbi:MAG TPA: hypothetical protein VN181_04560, partial [Thermoanaerobaculia bacterium]|nr:hypothetical protein [Thermoanaerobaculia bacterium]
VALYKISGAQPEPVDLKNYFRNYYGSPPSAAYARPGEYASTLRAVQPWKQNNKLYIMFSMHGLGDVYEIQAGDSLDGSSSLTGTQNPNNPTRATAPGPFPGDPITFTSATTGAFAVNVNWTFDNPELGAADVAVPKRTGDSVTYQYSALAAAAQIIRPRNVQVKGATDPTMAASFTITHKVPTVRVGVASLPGTLITAGTTPPPLVSGDSFTDASEGTIEGHFGNFVISPDGVNVNKHPNETVPAGQCGDHTLSFTAHYGPYNTSTFAPASASHYTDTIANLAYSVRPYSVALGSSTISGAGVVFAGSAQVGDASAFSTAVSLWNVSWTLKNGAGADIVPPQVTSVALGTIPTFTVANRALITAGSSLTLKAELPAASLTPACQNFSTATASTQFNLPDPVITRTGCDNAGSACSFTAASSASNTTGWSYVWRLRNTATNAVVATGAANPFTPAISAAGTYKAELDVTKTIFTVNAETPAFTTAAALCGALPTSRNMSVRWICPSQGCVPGAAIEFLPAPFGYVVQGCHTLTWSFGDNTGTQVQSGTEWLTGGAVHAYSGGGTYTVTLVFGSTASSETVTFTKPITIGTPPPPPPTCNDPSPVSFTYSGNKGCGPTKACTTTETVTFQALGSIQNCDSLRWSFDGVASTDPFPQKLYATPGNRTVSLTVRNTNPTTGA